MSNEMGQEDTVLGAQLRRAIETQPLRATPFSGSRIAMRLAGRERRSPLIPMLAAAAAVVLGLALGAALLGQRGQEPGGVAASPTPSPGATEAPSASPTATQGTDRIWVYFAVDQLPPVGAFVTGSFDDRSAERRITSRLIELRQASAAEVTAGAANPAAELGRDGVLELAVKVEGDLATVDFGPENFDRIRGAAQSQALLQQLVYTITEEPGIRRALIREAGRNAEIDQLVIEGPLTREDVLPYEGVRTEERVALEDDPRASTATTRVEVIPGGARFIIELKADETPAEGFWSPAMIAALAPNSEPARGLPGKSLLEIQLPEVRAASPQDRTLDSSPLRAVQTGSFPPHATGTIYTLAIDDARPWRVSLEPAEAGTMRLIVDIGGHPQAVSGSAAVYGPQPGDTVSRTFTITGAARAFEAHVAWRLKDASDREVATGFATASLGTSPVWGTFTTEVRVPAGVSGNVTLEVFWASPRDGADVDTVRIPLRVP